MTRRCRGASAKDGGDEVVMKQRTCEVTMWGVPAAGLHLPSMERAGLCLSVAGGAQRYLLEPAPC